MHCSTVQGDETGQGSALQQKLEGLNVSLLFCVGVGCSSIFSSHLPFALADPAAAKPLEGLLLEFVEQHQQHREAVLGTPGA